MVYDIYNVLQLWCTNVYDTNAGAVGLEHHSLLFYKPQHMKNNYVS